MNNEKCAAVLILSLTQQQMATTETRVPTGSL